jgi:hypothetical protein
MWRRIAKWCLLPILAAVPTIAAEGPPPPIRDFDIATIERLGQEMYAQDQEAWKATDLLFAHISENEARQAKIHGWITETHGIQDVVRFVHETDRGPEAYYDISFAGVAPPVLSAPGNRTLTPEELDQFNARRTAISATALNCSNTYNSVALKDPQGDGWLVWVMAASKDPDALMMGGHQRFTISKDGKTIVRHDALSHDCMEFSRKDARGGGHMFFSHIVSLTPVETHVFASLSYRIDFYLGTGDGRAWHIANGHITGVDPDMAGFEGSAARILIGQSEDCHLVVLGKGKDGKDVAPIPIKIVMATEAKTKFTIEPPPGVKIGGVMCLRNTLIPLPNDYKVLLAGYPLAIGDRGTGHAKAFGLLEADNGRLQFNMSTGKLADDQQKSMAARLNQMQKAMDAESAR